MDTLALTGMVIFTAWSATEIYIARRRRRETEADIAHLYGLIAGLLDAQPAIRLDIAERELERLSKTAAFDHHELGIARLRIDQIDRARAYPPQHVREGPC